ncbi:MAG: hypothetical protein HDT33_09170 [Clostridiales bacterium]|nr:hypothetical protein [Clostridiales bacterium]
MTNHELLNIIGEVNEDYVLAAGENVARPQFRWKTWAVCAACAALIVAAYPAWQGLSQKRTSDSVSDLDEGPEASQASDEVLVQRPGLHEYTLVEGGMTIMTTEGTAKAPAGGAEEPVPMPEPGGEAVVTSGAYVGNEDAGTADSAYSWEEASTQHERLLQSLGIDGWNWDLYPDWWGGIWLDWPGNTAQLAVAIVDDFHTPELEAQIRKWCGGTGEILFRTVKYSLAYLEDLKDEVGALFDQYGWLPSVIDANEMTNRVELDIFAMPGDDLLAALAELDPEGDAIFIQVFAGYQIIPTDGPAKEPALAAPAVEPSIEAEPTPVPADGSAAVAEPSVPPAP